MTTFVQRVEGDIVAVAEAAWTQIKAELQSLEQEVLDVIKADIKALVTSLEAGGGLSIEEMETALLNQWSASKPQIISALTSGAIQVLITAAKATVAVL